MLRCKLLPWSNMLATPPGLPYVNVPQVPVTLRVRSLRPVLDGCVLAEGRNRSEHSSSSCVLSRNEHLMEQAVWLPYYLADPGLLAPTDT